MRVPNIDSAMSRLSVRQPVVILDDIGIGLAPGVVNPALARGKISKWPTATPYAKASRSSEAQNIATTSRSERKLGTFSCGLFDYGRAATRSSHLRSAAQAWPGLRDLLSGARIERPGRILHMQSYKAAVAIDG